jgi:hypothetical protein
MKKVILILSFIDCPMQMRLKHAPTRYGFSECQPGGMIFDTAMNEKKYNYNFYKFTCLHVNMFTCLHVNMFTCLHVNMFTCLHVYM